MKKKLQKFETIMDGLARRHGVHQVFTDFLTMCICAFSMGKMEDRYFETIRRYEKPYAYSFSEALAALVIEMTGTDGNGLVDVLGKYFEENISRGYNGQFFTPQPVCDMLANINKPRTGDRILDPACGSGRMLMAAAKLNRFSLFFGADVDATCAKMATVNLCLNGMFGEIANMNSLTNHYFNGWKIYPGKKGCPTIREIPEEESYIHLKLPEEREKVVKIPKQTRFEF